MESDEMIRNEDIKSTRLLQVLHYRDGLLAILGRLVKFAGRCSMMAEDGSLVGMQS
jgi:hypothetical protein